MKKTILLFTILGCLIGTSAMAQQRTVLFSHQSVGRYMIRSVDAATEALRADQNIRDRVTDPLDSEVEFWDHDYSYNTASDESGTSFSTYGWRCGQNTDYDAWCVGMKQLIGDPFQDTPPDGYNGTTSAQAIAWRDFCSGFDIVIIKPGYRDIHLTSDIELQEYKDFLNAASDWWHTNNPGQYLCIMTSSSLRPPTGMGAPNDYSSTSGWANNDPGGDALIETERYAAFELWLAKTWACRNPENRVFAMFRKCTNLTGGDYITNFTKTEYTNDPDSSYDSGDHHLNKRASNELQDDFVTFINGMVSEMNEVTTRPQFRIDY